MQRQKFTTTIKYVTEEKGEKKNLKSLIGCLSANKINNYNRGGFKRGKKTGKNLKEFTEQVKK